jgi:hypothetical protein
VVAANSRNENVELILEDIHLTPFFKGSICGVGLILGTLYGVDSPNHRHLLLKHLPHFAPIFGVEPRRAESLFFWLERCAC